MMGRQLGRYRILAPLGAGGMGEVFRAWDERLRREVALKLLPAGTVQDEDSRHRFRREAFALSQLNHPNIATVHDFDHQDGVDFIVMELIEGVGLDERVASGPLPEAEVVAIGIALASGLAAAHARGLIHRDLKPANLMLTKDGRLKILDFGLSKLADPGHTASTLTGPETVTGTTAYMSPEQIKGEKDTPRSDLWGCGVVLYELATGRKPFGAGTAAQIIYRVLNEAPEPPRQVNPAISEQLQSVIEWLLGKDPHRRCPDAGQLRAALENTAAGARVRLPGRHRMSRPVLVGVLLAVVAVAVGIGLGAGRGGWRLTGPPAARALAVLPLENLSRDLDQEYFADGMTEELIVELS